jgi:hypothetical protein
LRFTVHRPARPEVSPRCYRPSGGDVAGGIHFGIARPRTTGDAVENRLVLAIFAHRKREVPQRLLPLRGQIPRKPGVAAAFGQCCALLRAGQQPKPAHRNNIDPTTDNEPKGGRRRLLRPKPGVCTPQIS